MGEMYARLREGRYEQVPRSRWGVVDHVTSFSHDPDELIETTYSYSFRAFAPFIRENLTLSVDERTETLANAAALRFLAESGLFDPVTNRFYDERIGYPQRGLDFNSLLRYNGCGRRAFLPPRATDTTALVWGDQRHVDLDEAKRIIRQYG